MGVVYRATHLTQGTPVALKVDLHPPDPASRAAFLHEVQIIAALDHPNVVMILDHGEVDRGAQRDSEGELREGARWLAMELAMGGSTSEMRPRSWAEVLHVTHGLLNGLAHAHARGVVHRDIKSQNLLLAGDESSVATRPRSLLDARVVLSDFGVSEQRDVTALRTEDSVGTPQYMAPEQIEGDWRAQGPWTDLYSVGILLWRFCTGTLPFRGKNAFSLFRQHLSADPPPFRPAMGVPEGTEALLRTLLAKDPADRPEFAIDVRRALDQLGDPIGEDGPDDLADEDFETVTRSEAPLTGRTRGTRTRGRLTSVPEQHGGRRQNVQLHGAGLGLYGLRTVPFVGRKHATDTLWAELVAVRTQERARAILVRGPSGIGKSRLAAWLRHRVHELGVASSLVAEHAAGAMPGTSMIDMLRRDLRTSGLDAEGLEHRLASLFPEAAFDLRALAAMLEPGVLPRRPPGPAESRQLVIAVLSQLARQRPVVVVLDDAHRDLATLEMVDSLLTLQELHPRRILVVVTVADEALVDDPDVAELLDELSHDPSVRELRLEPLVGEGRQQLVRAMLGLQGALAQQIEDRTQGNPAFARQLIGSWIEQGVLIATPSGFSLAPGARSRVPRDIRSVWQGRLEDALSSFAEHAIEPFELAAAFGESVDWAAWEGACALFDMAIDRRAFEDLEKRHLIRMEDPTGQRWRFAHGMLREVLEESAREAGSWREHNLAIAVWLRENPGRPALDLARHLLEAEVYDQAIPVLEEAINDQIDRHDLRDPTLYDAFDRCMDALGLADDAPERGQLMVLRAVRHRARGEIEDASRLAEDSVADAQDFGWTRVEPKALREAARVQFAQANFDGALSRALEAERAFMALDDRLRAADCSYTAAELLSVTGKHEEAEGRFLTCIEVFREEGPEFLHNALLGMMLLQQRRGNAEAAAHWMDACRTHAESLGLQGALAYIANIEGELHRGAGQLDAAGRAYREAAERYQALESADFAFPLINLGIIDVDLERFDAAVQRMQPVRVYCRRHPSALVEAYTHMVLMAGYAGTGHRVAASDSLNHLVGYVSQSSLVDPDLAAMAEQTGQLMRRQGWDAESERALRLSLNQWRAAERPDDVKRVRSLLR